MISLDDIRREREFNGLTMREISQIMRDADGDMDVAMRLVREAEERAAEEAEREAHERAKREAEEALARARREMLLTGCPSCGVTPGMLHQHACTIALCKSCGYRTLSCSHPLEGNQTRWRGDAPGEVEVEQGLARRLSDLMMAAMRGDLVWDPDAERWELNWRDAEFD